MTALSECSNISLRIANKKSLPKGQAFLNLSYSPAVSAALTDALRVLDSFCFGVGSCGNNEDETEGANCENYPKEPAEAAPALCFNFGHNLGNDVLTFAFRTYHFQNSFQLECIFSIVRKYVVKKSKILTNDK